MSNKRWRDITQAVIEEGHTLLEITQQGNGHLKARCEDRGGRQFHLTFPNSPRTEESAAILRRYVRQGYARFESTAEKFKTQAHLEVNTEIEVKAGKTDQQLKFESQNGKRMREAVGVA
jgi:hypothetical protein